jgi:hypothetical protein
MRPHVSWQDIRAEYASNNLNPNLRTTPSWVTESFDEWAFNYGGGGGGGMYTDAVKTNSGSMSHEEYANKYGGVSFGGGENGLLGALYYVNAGKDVYDAGQFHFQSGDYHYSAVFGTDNGKITSMTYCMVLPSKDGKGWVKNSDYGILVFDQKQSDVMQAAVAFAGTAAVADGPFPYGDLVGGAALAGVMFNELINPSGLVASVGEPWVEPAAPTPGGQNPKRWVKNLLIGGMIADLLANLAEHTPKISPQNWDLNGIKSALNSQLNQIDMYFIGIWNTTNQGIRDVNNAIKQGWPAK